MHCNCMCCLSDIRRVIFYNCSLRNPLCLCHGINSRSFRLSRLAWPGRVILVRTIAIRSHSIIVRTRITRPGQANRDSLNDLELIPRSSIVRTRITRPGQANRDSLNDLELIPRSFRLSSAQ